jgi:hypothetical protein
MRKMGLRFDNEGSDTAVAERPDLRIHEAGGKNGIIPNREMKKIAVITASRALSGISSS